MDSASAAVMVSPSSDDRVWSSLRDRVDAILEHRRRPKRCSPPLTEAVGSEAGKRFREDSLLLIRGLDSAASSLSHLTHSLNSAQQNLSELARPSLANLQQRDSHGAEEEDKNAQPNAKRHRGPNSPPNKDEEGPGNAEEAEAEAEAEHASADVGRSGNLKKARNLAISMASKAASLARELKAIKSELCFVQERCALLEEENTRLRDGVEKGVRAEEDDLVRLQLEALLAEKSRLANENANLARENQCLHQLVEYHQLATQDPSSPSYEQATVHGVCLDFSSPTGNDNDTNSEDGDEEGCEENESAAFP